MARLFCAYQLMLPPNNTTIYTVENLNQEIKTLLEMSYKDIWVEGEVSSTTTPQSGHTYFTLKQGSHVLKSVLFKNRKYLATCLPKIGERLLVRGRVSVYPGRGDVQLICSYIETAGEGILRQQFEALKKTLADEGLFDQSAKQSLPIFARKIALISSPQGAVLHDIITTLRQRCPLSTLTVYPASVQGEKAQGEFLAALKIAVENKPDVIIIARGGGSLEDLQTFNDEKLARALAACPLPTISAIGHETDVVITDFVADARAATPTAAVALITPDIRILRQNLTQSRDLLKKRIYEGFNSKQQSLDYAIQGLRHPRDNLSLQTAQTQQLSLRLKSAHLQTLRAYQQKLEPLKLKLSTVDPSKRLDQNRFKLEVLRSRLNQTMRHSLRGLDTTLSTLNAQLVALNPSNILSRGYAILYDKRGKAIISTDQVSTGDPVLARLHKGKLHMDIKKKSP